MHRDLQEDQVQSDRKQSVEVRSDVTERNRHDIVAWLSLSRAQQFRVNRHNFYHMLPFLLYNKAGILKEPSSRKQHALAVQ